MRIALIRREYITHLDEVSWPGDAKRVALKIDKIEKMGFKPSMSSRQAIRKNVSLPQMFSIQ